jgi:D-beta-D-heptose 7-phosphate kinase/D-beta-D-heptose 1-phosphate adenosyltransferase
MSNNPHDLQKLMQDFAGRVRERKLRVAVVGDMILDNTIEGTPGGRHPEINVPILRNVTYQETIGGAANIALALSRLGVEASLFGVVGSDLPGRQLENLLDRQPFADYLVTERGWPTPRKDWIYHRVAGKLTLNQRIDYDKPLPGRAREELVGEFRARCADHVDVVILVDHDLGSMGPESLALVSLARERKAKVVAIPRTTVLRGQPVDAICINSPEIRLMYGADAGADPRALAARFARDYSQHVFLTLLEEGIYVCPAGAAEECTLVRGYPLQNGHWMGARDMATTIVAMGLALGMDVLAIGRLATAFRHLVAAQLGNGRVQWRDINQFVGLPET